MVMMITAAVRNRGHHTVRRVFSVPTRPRRRC